MLFTVAHVVASRIMLNAIMELMRSILTLVVAPSKEKKKLINN